MSRDVSSSGKAQFPIYVRIVPKDVWLRFHISSTQTMASLKDAALHHARMPEHDPTHSVRFYLDAADATLNAKQALAAGNAQMTKQRNHALPTVFTTPLPADLAPTLIKNAASFSSSTTSPRQNLISLPHRAALSALASWSPGKNTSASNHDKRSNARVQNSANNELYQPLSSSPSQRRPGELASSSSTRAISAYDPLTSVHSRSTTNSLPSSDESAQQLDASLVRGNTHAKQEEHKAQVLLQQWSQTSASIPHGSTARTSPHSPHKTPTLTADSSFSAADDDQDSIARRSNLFAQMSLDPTSDTSSSSALPLAGVDPSIVNVSPARPRSRTVTAADAQNDASMANDATLRARGRPFLVAETAQRRQISQDLTNLFTDPDKSSSGVVRPASPTTTLVDVDAVAHADTFKPQLAGGKGWTERSRLASVPVDDIAHALSKRYSVLSATTGCVLEDWKSAAACRLRPYDMVQLQWFVPTERVYTPCFTSDFVRHAVRDSIAGPHPDSDLLEPYYEGWVYLLEEGQGKQNDSKKAAAAAAAAARLQLATWKLRWITVKGWRLDVYRQRPRAGEISLPASESIWPLLAVQQVNVADSPIAANALMPALETLHGSSISLSFSSVPVNASNSTGDPSPTLIASAPSVTLRCISRFEHEALYRLLCRAQRRAAAQLQAKRGANTHRIDHWRRQALFRALVAGRGGTIHAQRTSRNAKLRSRQRPPTWPTAWEDVDQWSSQSETEDDESPTAPSSQIGLLLR